MIVVRKSFCGLGINLKFLEEFLVLVIFLFEKVFEWFSIGVDGYRVVSFSEGDYEVVVSVFCFVVICF